MRLVEQRDPEVPVYAACQALNVSRASLYRSWRPPAPSSSPVTRERAPSPRRLDDAERQEILDTLHLPKFADQPPTEVYATLLERGTYLASIRTMYRVLAEAGETKERRNQRAPQQHATPSLTATAPNQIWTWDITKPPPPSRRYQAAVTEQPPPSHHHEPLPPSSRYRAASSPNSSLPARTLH